MRQLLCVLALAALPLVSACATHHVVDAQQYARQHPDWFVCARSNGDCYTYHRKRLLIYRRKPLEQASFFGCRSLRKRKHIVVKALPSVGCAAEPGKHFPSGVTPVGRH